MRKCDPAHKIRQRTIFYGPKEQMPMITHNTIAADTHVKAIKPLGYDFLKGFEIPILLKDL